MVVCKGSQGLRNADLSLEMAVKTEALADAEGPAPSLCEAPAPKNLPCSRIFNSDSMS